jgi:hypothetical protein
MLFHFGASRRIRIVQIGDDLAALAEYELHTPILVTGAAAQLLLAVFLQVVELVSQDSLERTFAQPTKVVLPLAASRMQCIADCQGNAAVLKVEDNAAQVIDRARFRYCASQAEPAENRSRPVEEPLIPLIISVHAIADRNRQLDDIFVGHDANTTQTKTRPRHLLGNAEAAITRAD